jgi:SAM-dependent methyltransferase
VPKIDFAFREVGDEWDAIWTSRDVEDEARAIDRQSSFYGAIRRAVLSSPVDGVVLEGGCGLGRWLLHWRAARRLVGIERSIPAITALRQFAPDAVVAAGDVFRLPLRDNTVDCYLSLGVLEHFEGGPEGGLREGFRVLKPLGMLFISGPGAPRLSLADGLIDLSRHPILRKVMRRPPLPQSTQFFQYRFRPNEVREFLRREGFKVVSEIGWGSQETLWQYVPLLRHRDTRHFRWYRDALAANAPRRLNAAGRIVHRVLSAASPWLMQYAWAVLAQKPG